ncbi:hypothetical protein BKA70DRAFT_466193 [Coprinopsis sp. MPI-PUGE-AT-0042]|nr:hypothetical protein BKA70DRAFT_466193 [Coprinopsis sp. MPI-PUGE-AT-0042]
MVQAFSCFLFTPIKTLMSMISHSTMRPQGEGSGGVADMVRGESIGGSMEFYPSQWSSAEQSVGRNEKEAVASQTGLNEHGSNQTQGNSQSTSIFDDAPTVTVTAASSDDEMQFRGLGPIHPDYWYHGDQAGGFLLDFGEFKGRPVREVRWDWLQWALRQLNKQPRHEALLIAIARFKAGHSEDLRDNWRDYRVSFGRKA